MFNRDTKTVRNALLSMVVPKDYRRGVGSSTELVAIQDLPSSVASIAISLVPKVELDTDDENELLARFLKRIESSDAPITLLPTPAGFEKKKAVAVLFERHLQGPEFHGVIEYRHFCLPYNDDFFVNVVGVCDASTRDGFLSALDTAISSRKLCKPITIEEYKTLMTGEIARVTEAQNELRAEYGRAAGRSKEELAGLLENLISEFDLQVTKMEIGTELSMDATFYFDNEDCDIAIESAQLDMAARLITEARQFLQQLEFLNTQAKNAIADDMLELYNSSWRNNGEPMGRAEFIADLRRPHIGVNEHFCSIFYQSKKDLFLGHTLFVEYELFQNFEKYHASMVG